VRHYGSSASQDGWSETEETEDGPAIAPRVVMLRSICLKLVKVTAVVVCLGIGTSACWGYGHDGRDGRYGRDDHHEERHEERR
jgi:hypothetical protein